MAPAQHNPKEVSGRRAVELVQDPLSGSDALASILQLDDAFAAHGLCVSRSGCGRNTMRITGLDSVAGMPLAGPWT